MIKKYFGKLDYGIIASVIVLIAIGLVSLYSASHGAFSNAGEFTKQIRWVIAGGIAFFACSLVDYKYLKKVSLVVYIVMIILLIAVLFSPQNNGATSWFKVGRMSFQPAEFSKIAIIIVLAKLIESFENTENLNKPSNFILMGIIIAIPVVLIVMQPDYGTALVILAFSALMIFMGGIKIRYIILAFVLGILAMPIVYNTILPEHAKKRIEVFFNPSLDPSGAGYNVIQSELAVGAGELTGMGFLNGNQTQLGTLPMKTTDFIFAVISEEFGFVVSTIVITLYVLMLLRLLHIAKISKDKFGEIVCIGTFAMILFHVIENIGMCMGILPVTGIPLPLISYGGSSMLTNMVLLGTCESISVHRKKHLL